MSQQKPEALQSIDPTKRPRALYHGTSVPESKWVGEVLAQRRNFTADQTKKVDAVFATAYFPAATGFALKVKEKTFAGYGIGKEGEIGTFIVSQNYKYPQEGRVYEIGSPYLDKAQYNGHEWFIEGSIPLKDCRIHSVTKEDAMNQGTQFFRSTNDERFHQLNQQAFKENRLETAEDRTKFMKELLDLGVIKHENLKHCKKPDHNIFHLKQLLQIPPDKNWQCRLYAEKAAKILKNASQGELQK
jgi:hypothetical protein